MAALEGFAVLGSSIDELVEQFEYLGFYLGGY